MELFWNFIWNLVLDVFEVLWYCASKNTDPDIGKGSELMI